MNDLILFFITHPVLSPGLFAQLLSPQSLVLSPESLSCSPQSLFFTIPLVAVALGCDAFAVGLGVGTRFCQPRQTFRLSFHFGLFQFMMPVLGWFLSRRLPPAVRVWGPWIAFALLFFIGAKMVAQSLRGSDARACAGQPAGADIFAAGSRQAAIPSGAAEPAPAVHLGGGPPPPVDPTRGLSLAILSVAASLDALGVGFSMGMLGSAMIAPAIWFGLTAGAMTWVSMRLGNRLSTKFGRGVEAAGGLILIALAIEFVV